MGVTFSEPLEKLCLGVFVVFVTAAAVTYGVQQASLGAPSGGKKPRRKPEKAASAQ